MLTSEAIGNLRSRLLSGFTILFLETWEEDRWESQLKTLARDLELGLVVWSVTDGLQPPLHESDGKSSDPLALLGQIENYAPENLFLLKDFHPYLTDAKVVRKLRDLVPNLQQQNKSLLFIGPNSVIPMELRKDAIRIELPWPGIPEIRHELNAVLEQRNSNGRPLKVDEV